MRKTTITVTEAARNFADCVNRAHYQNLTFELLKNGAPFAQLGPAKKAVCLGADLADILAGVELSDDEARSWSQDLRAGRRAINRPADKWR